MTQHLPCPFCGHLHPKPNHSSKFKCESPSCRKWLELPTGGTELQDYEARKAAEKARIDKYWRGVASAKAKKEGIDFETAHKLVLEGRDKNSQNMRKAARVKALFPPEPVKPKAQALAPQAFTNNTQPIVAMSTTTDDDTDAPF
ncbi:MAG: hypothetical protein E6Q51_04280 [Methylophilus methylotrophus]|uniref:Uncharacterized protein n=1 Tax=Methylophilus methylotrophus TaxID=17 RepID=A0A5C7WI03_METME|nr:MAG: hypothetical protein E6Q51_04280 [Methylophilus methylotrophus]